MANLDLGLLSNARSLHFRSVRARPQPAQYGLAHRQDALAYALKYARDMDTALADRLVGMYVNDWTLDYGERGRRAVQLFLERGAATGIVPGPARVEFVDE